MDALYVDIDVDLFEYKDKILANLSTKELIDEINERGKDKDNYKCVEILNQYFTVDISEFDSDILSSIDDSEVLSEMKDRELQLDIEDISKKNIILRMT